MTTADRAGAAGSRTALRVHATGLLLWLGVCVSVASGCDRAPWASSGGGQTATAAPAATPAAAPASGSTPSAPEVAAADVLASVNGTPISREELRLILKDAKLLTEGRGEQWEPPTPERLKQIFDGLVQDELASQEKAAQGKYDEEAKLRWVTMRRNFLAGQWLRLNQGQLDVTPEEIQKFYDDFKVGFRESEKRQLRQISVASEADARRAMGRLYGESVDFGALAQEMSLAPSRNDGGLLALWVMRRADRDRRYGLEGADERAKADGVMSLLDPAQEAAAFAIDHEKGLSNYVKGADGRYHIFQLVKLQPERQMPPEEVRDWIRTTLLTQKLQDAMKDLRSKATVQEFPERLQGLAP